MELSNSKLSGNAFSVSCRSSSMSSVARRKSPPLSKKSSSIERCEVSRELAKDAEDLGMKPVQPFHRGFSRHFYPSLSR